MSETPSSPREVQEVSTQQGYALWADMYDQEKNALIAVEDPQVERLLDQIAFSNALDVGTGTGRLALKLARRGAKVTAIDQSPEMLAVARQAAQREGLKIDFRPGSPGDEIFAEPRFDLLTCGLVLCHVPDLMGTIEQFARALQPGGYTLITDFHPATRDYGWRTSFVREGIGYVLPNLPHTRDDYLKALTMNRFTVLEVMDLLVRDVPDGYLPEGFRERHAEKFFCLIILAQKEEP